MFHHHNPSPLFPLLLTLLTLLLLPLQTVAQVAAPPNGGPGAAALPTVAANGIITQTIATTLPDGVVKSVATVVTLGAGAGPSTFGPPMSGEIGLGTLTGSVGAVKTAKASAGAANARQRGMGYKGWLLGAGLGALGVLV